MIKPPQYQTKEAPPGKTISNKIQAKQRVWGPQYRFVAIQPPIFVYDAQTPGGIKKLLKIRFKYKQTKTSKPRSHTIVFGNPQDEYVIDKNEEKRKKRFQTLKRKDDPFFRSFWRLHICNTQETVQVAYAKLVQKIFAQKN